jgi:hypothetical protein
MPIKGDKRLGDWLVDHLRSLATDAARELNVLGHDRDTLGVDRAQVRVLKETNEVSLGSFLEREHGRALETQVRLEVLRDFTHKTLERKLANEELGRLLVATDLTERDRTRAVTVRLLDAASGGRTLTSGLGGELLARSLAAGRLTSGLLGTGHGGWENWELVVFLGWMLCRANWRMRLPTIVPPRAPNKHKSPEETRRLGREKFWAEKVGRRGSNNLL